MEKSTGILLVAALGIGAVDVPVVYAQEKVESGSAYLGTNEAATVMDAQTESPAAADGTTAGNDVDKSSVETENGGWDQVTTEKVFEGDDYRVTFSLVSYWETGYNANIKLENTGNSTIQNWKLGFRV